LEIGQQEDLAADVDDGAADEDSDPEGLDSSDDEELGLDMLDEESEGEHWIFPNGRPQLIM
jgi:hypothetical protein